MSGPKKGSKTVYWKILNGKIVKPCKEGVEGAIKHEITKGKNQGKVVFLEPYNQFEATIVEIRKKTTPFGTEKNPDFALEVVMAYGGKKEVLSMGFDSGYATDLLARIPNLKISQECTIAPYAIEDENGNTNYGIVLYQDGEKIERYWGGPDSGKPVLPRWTEHVIGGKSVWDKSEYLETLWRKALSAFDIDSPKAETASGQMPQNNEFDQQKKEEFNPNEIGGQSNDDDEDDLPF